MKRGMLLALMLSMLGTPALACEFYAWVNYGPAPKDRQPDNTEAVYKSSGVMQLEHGFKAVYSDVGETRHVTGFQIENLGPFENGAVAERALSDFIGKLEDDGYSEATARHDLPQVLERDKVACE